MPAPQLYVITGKGGVGKTTVGLGLCLSLLKQKKKVKYLYFKNSSLNQKVPLNNEDLNKAKELGIPTVGLDLKKCAEQYIAKKMKSNLIASFVVATPFFVSLVNMIPGFNYLIYLGRTLEYLKEDPELTLVMDSPASGHALTLFEATYNFRSIFKSGPIFDDTQKMLDFLHLPGKVRSIVLGIPTLMAMHEGLELKEQLKELAKLECDFYCNDMITELEGEQDGLPPYLKKRLENENSVREQFSEQIKGIIPHSLQTNFLDIVKDITPYTDQIIREGEV